MKNFLPRTLKNIYELYFNNISVHSIVSRNTQLKRSKIIQMTTETFEDIKLEDIPVDDIDFPTWKNNTRSLKNSISISTSSLMVPQSSHPPKFLF